MRKLKCFQVHGLSVSEVLDEFNERAEEFGVKERDIISVSTLPPDPKQVAVVREGETAPKVQVVIAYWADI